MNRFKDKVVVITGGNSGIGYATASMFVDEGAKVVITGRRKDALEKAATGIGATAILADQSKVNDLENMAREVQNSLGRVAVLVINAGVAQLSPIAFASEEQFDSVMDINLKGSFFTLQKLLPVLEDGASVIFISSNITSMVMPNSAIYAASKAGVNQLMKTAAKELAARKIRVNAISPGPTDTDIINKFGFDEATLEGAKRQILQSIPLQKTGVPGDVAALAAYLSDPATSSFITGAEFLIDGGMVL
jgi:NAD(P)-dependent dehydrogenase (short-subunit alcohol dehydrogenase family)